MVIIRKPRERGLVDIPIVGVQDTGGRSSNGATLKNVTAGVVANGGSSSLSECTLTTSFFDGHPSYQFSSVIVSSNYFMEIPIAYWWRGNLPDVANKTTPRWTMLLSAEPITVTIDSTSCEFTASPGAFKKSGSWLSSFLFGTYRAWNNSGVPGSQPNKTTWNNVSYQTFKSAAEGMGNGHHMVSLHEWHEILARAVVEKKTFQILNESSRSNASLCKYRGIEDFAYSGTVWGELLDGVRTNSTGKYELWTEANGSYSTTSVTCPQDSGSDSTYYTQSLQSGSLFDHVFLGNSLGASSTCFIPDYCGRNSGVVDRICYTNAGYSMQYAGAFSVAFGYTTTTTNSYYGSRLSKW